jgi:hypothetical protein
MNGPLSQFSPALREGSLLEYWIEVVDNNNVTGPGVGVSEHQYGKIVSEADKRADLFNGRGITWAASATWRVINRR